MLIGCFIAQVIDRASDLGSECDKEGAMTPQPRIDDDLVAPLRRGTDRKGLAGSLNRNLAETDRGGVKEKN